jgi:hypothetical protein
VDRTFATKTAPVAFSQPGVAAGTFRILCALGLDRPGAVEDLGGGTASSRNKLSHGI